MSQSKKVKFEKLERGPSSSRWTIVSAHEKGIYWQSASGKLYYQQHSPAGPVWYRVTFVAS